MSVTALHLYEQPTEAPDDKSRARIIAEAFGELEERYPHIKEIATTSQLRETELRLQKEIRELEVQIKEVEARLMKEIREVDARLTKDIKEVELKITEAEVRLSEEVKRVEVKVMDVEIRLTQAIHRQSLWIIGSIGTIIGGIRLLDWFLARL